MKFISLFAGIGGFDLALTRNGHEVVYANEWDKYAATIYDRHFTKCDQRDIRSVTTSELPDFDLLVGGFPCQAFSVAGKRRGFEDTRGTLFFEIARILADKRPRYFILENVKGLLNHDRGQTFSTILGVLATLGYEFQWSVLNSKNFGVPQNRERVFIVGHTRGTPRPQIFPVGEFNLPVPQTSQPVKQGEERFIKTRHLSQNGTLISNTITLQASEQPHIIAGRINRDNFESTKDESLCLTANYWKGPDNHGARTVLKQTGIIGKDSEASRVYDPSGISRTIKNGGGMGAKTGLYQTDAKIRRLTPLECERLQGFPDGWTEGISDTQRYKCLGNAVTVNVVEFVAKCLPLDNSAQL